MRHTRAGEESLDTLHNRTPKQTRINGQVYIHFEDVIYNLLLSNLKHVDFREVSHKTQSYAANYHVMSPRHRKRMEKQLKKVSGIR